MAKRRYDQYCPIAHALEAVGERWSLLLVRELSHGPLRYTDCLERLPGCSTNVLATRLRELEAAGIVTREKLPPPAASTVYRLTADGEALGPVLGELALWGLRRLGPPPEAVEPGWLGHALQIVGCASLPEGALAFRTSDEELTVVDGRVVPGLAPEAEAVVTCDASGLYELFVHGSVDAVTVDGDRRAVERLAARAPLRAEAAAV